jgi:hypothetical protein
MTTSLWIWTIFHFLALLSTIFSKKPDASSSSAIIVITWLAFGAMLWAGYPNWFLWTNIPLLLLMGFAGIAQLGKPPSATNEDEAARALWGVAFRLGLVLTCWFTY